MADTVTERFRAGTLTDQDKEDLARILSVNASKLARSFNVTGFKFEEYYSAAMFGVAKALASSHKIKEEEDLEQFVGKCIYREIQAHRIRDHLIPVPRETITAKRARGEEIVFLKPQPLSEIEGIRILTQNYYEEILYHLEQSAKSDIDLQIIQARIEGYNDGQIATIMGKSESQIQRRRSKIEEKYLRRTRRKSCDSF